jgi:hypothetical protein
MVRRDETMNTDQVVEESKLATAPEKERDETGGDPKPGSPGGDDLWNAKSREPEVDANRRGSKGTDEEIDSHEAQGDCLSGPNV